MATIKIGDITVKKQGQDYSVEFNSIPEDAYKYILRAMEKVKPGAVDEFDVMRRNGAHRKINVEVTVNTSGEES